MFGRDAASSSWEEKLSFVVKQGHSSALAFHDDDELLLGSIWPTTLDDNISLQCPEPTTIVCSDDYKQQVLERILRWIKLIVLKLARSYYAFPIVLVAIPLCVGLAIGFWFGYKYRGKGATQQIPQPASSNGNNGLYPIVSSLLLRVWLGVVAGSKKRLLESSSSSDAASNTELKPQETEVRLLSEGRTIEERESLARSDLKSNRGTERESGVDVGDVPKHIAVIMDGNRRYGKARYNGNATRGHWDGSRKLLEFAKWCMAEQVQVLTVYAFSTENWRRDPVEVSALMDIFAKYCEELRVEAIERNIRVRVLSTDSSKIPCHVKSGLEQLERDTLHCHGGLEMNVCLSYGSRGEIVNACKSLAHACVEGRLHIDGITERTFGDALLSSRCPDPDVLIRTSGEVRMSNFLLWQLAYTELFFVDWNWPEFTKDNLLDIIRSYANGRQRRFGK